MKTSGVHKLMGKKYFDQLKDVISCNSCRLDGLHWPVFKQTDDTIQTLTYVRVRFHKL